MPIHLLAFLGVICVGVAGCSTRYERKPTTASPNAEILDEINQAWSWFHAKKVRPIWARQLDKDETVKTIEGTEQVKAGDFLCRGEAGDVWPQTAKSLNEKYQKTEEVDADGWQKYVPRPDNQGAMAAQVQRAFVVHAKWGVLSGKPGDYIVKSFADRDVAHPDDVWIVDQKLFRATYRAVDGTPWQPCIAEQVRRSFTRVVSEAAPLLTSAGCHSRSAALLSRGGIMSLESFPVIAKWAALVLAVLTLLRVPPLLSRWSAARQVYGRIPWSLARQMLWYTRKSPMAFPVKASFLCLPFTIAGGVRQLFFDDPIGYFLLGLAAQAHSLVRTADVVLPPTVLLLGASTTDATHTLGHLNTFLPSHRTVALLHPRERLPFDVVQAFYFNNLRTAHTYEWRSIVFHLMDVVPVIVIDAASDSPAVAEELRRIERHGYHSRVVLVAGGAGGPGGRFAQVERSELPRWIAVRLGRVTDYDERMRCQAAIAGMLTAVPPQIPGPEDRQRHGH